MTRDPKGDGSGGKKIDKKKVESVAKADAEGAVATLISGCGEWSLGFCTLAVAGSVSIIADL